MNSISICIIICPQACDHVRQCIYSYFIHIFIHMINIILLKVCYSHFYKDDEYLCLLISEIFSKRLILLQCYAYEFTFIHIFIHILFILHSYTPPPSKSLYSALQRAIARYSAPQRAIAPRFSKNNEKLQEKALDLVTPQISLDILLCQFDFS